MHVWRTAYSRRSTCHRHPSRQEASGSVDAHRRAGWSLPEALLKTATQFGLTEQAQKIQQEIALLDAKLQEQGLQQGFTTANNNIGLGYAQLTSQMNRDAMLAGLRG